MRTPRARSGPSYGGDKSSLGEMRPGRYSVLVQRSGVARGADLRATTHFEAGARSYGVGASGRPSRAASESKWLGDNMSELGIVLRAFWKTAMRLAKHRGRRRALCRSYSQIKVTNCVPYFILRRRFRMAPPKDRCCFCCPAPASCWHHVIQLNHGGRNTRKNLVPICRECHRIIHPWLQPPVPFTRAFNTDMRPRLVPREKHSEDPHR